MDNQTKKQTDLTDDERLALSTVRQMRNWRKRMLISQEEYMERIPKGIDAAIWASWYLHPFGNQEFNRRVSVVRELVRTGRA